MKKKRWRTGCTVLILLFCAALLCGCSEKKIEEQQYWHAENGFYTMVFAKGTCEMTCHGLGDAVYTTNYRVKAGNLELVDDEGTILYTYAIEEDVETGGIACLKSEKDDTNSLLPGRAESSQTFETAYEPYKEEAIEEAERLYEEGSPKHLHVVMNNLTRELSNSIDDVYELIEAITGEPVEDRVETPMPEPIPGRLYLPKDTFKFETYDIEARSYEPMPFADEDAFLEHLLSTLWYENAWFMNPEAQMFNDGYMHIDLMAGMMSSIWLEFTDYSLTYHFGNILTFEEAGSRGFFADVVTFGDSYGMMIEYTDDFVYYEGELYYVRVMHFIEKHGLLVQSCGLYNGSLDVFIPMSTYIVFSDGMQTIWLDFDGAAFADAEAFAAALTANEWQLYEWPAVFIKDLYTIDAYSPKLEMPQMPETISFDEETVERYRVAHDALFIPQGTVSLGGTTYPYGLHVALDSEGELNERLALYDETAGEYLFTSHNWLYQPPEAEAATGEEPAE